MRYFPRVVDHELSMRLGATPCVVIQGPKWCGKTETARQQAESEITIDDSEAIKQRLEITPESILGGKTPRLIDEWQEQLRIWNLIRHKVDSRRSSGQFILTGSSIPTDDLGRHSGAGRFSFIKMRPMTLFESKFSSGEVSLEQLMGKRSIRGIQSNLTIPELAKQIVVGGWPALIQKNEKEGVRAVRDYVTQICELDGPRTSKFVRDPAKFEKVLISLARNISTEAKVETIISDVSESNQSFNRDSIFDILESLNRVMVTEDLPAWSTHLRSKAIMRKSNKRHFIDPSIAASVLGCSAAQLLDDLEFFGLIFESLVIRDLRVYAQSFDAKVYHYRDSNGLEVDAIVQMRDGSWGAFEVKLGLSNIDEAANKLLKLASQVDEKKVGKPSVLGVITGADFGGTREDGIAVIPIGSLGP